MRSEVSIVGFKEIRLGFGFNYRICHGGFVFFIFIFGWPTIIYFYFFDMIFLLV